MICSSCSRSFEQRRDVRKDPDVCDPCKSAAGVRRYRERLREQDPERMRQMQFDNRLWHRFRIRRDQYDEILKAQGGGCLACGGTDKLSVDHDHLCCPGPRSCGSCVRGILCARCNSALGLVEDRVDVLEKLVIYLNESVSVTDT